jgi:hypothetical protein
MAKGKVQMANGYTGSSGRQSAGGSWLQEPSAVESELLAGYRAMARDQAQEAEALEWCEGLIADAIPPGE